MTINEAEDVFFAWQAGQIVPDWKIAEAILLLKRTEPQSELISELITDNTKSQEGEV